MSSTIIFGSRGINDYQLLLDSIQRSGFDITEVVEGECANSPDLLGKRYARESDIPCVEFPANWTDLSHKDAVIKTKNGRKYDAKAGFRRNLQMAQYAASTGDGCAIGLIHKHGSNGSNDMKKQALLHNLKCYFVSVEPKIDDDK
jgi:hypothetical protein